MTELETLLQILFQGFELTIIRSLQGEKQMSQTSYTSKYDGIFDPDTERIDEINEKLSLIQKKSGLVFGTDAYMLSAYVKKSPRAVACELGSGTGVAALLLLAKEKVNRVYAYEIQQAFSDLIGRNAALNRVEDKLFVIAKDIRKAVPTDIGGECDIVISNPPYMKTDSGKRNGHDEKYIARHEVCGDIYDFVTAAKRLLKFGGSFYCVYRPDRLVDLISALRQNALEPKLMTFIHSDRESEPSMVLIEARKGGRPSLRITEPLLIYDNTANAENSETRRMSDAAQTIYNTCSFEHITKTQASERNQNRK